VIPDKTPSQNPEFRTQTAKDYFSTYGKPYKTLGTQNPEATLKAYYKLLLLQQAVAGLPP
jgi:hypothetical protein